MSFEEAADILTEQAGSKFDRRVVVALINYVENRGGGSRWSDFMKTRDDFLQTDSPCRIEIPPEAPRPQNGTVI
jgi:hypothetical protein